MEIVLNWRFLSLSAKLKRWECVGVVWMGPLEWSLNKGPASQPASQLVIRQRASESSRCQAVWLGLAHPLAPSPSFRTWDRPLCIHFIHVDPKAPRLHWGESCSSKGPSGWPQHLPLPRASQGLKWSAKSTPLSFPLFKLSRLHPRRLARTGP